ncbi:dihydrolipoyl dehydrogenase [Pectobacterium aroidearum]|uniref:dihydrolipoyl dehydrogenase n=1 Tax=Pectobacterium aroidearum TaxID=1201031 RepID=UPI0021149441|nr:dihydrolipoyl dehydrogenase [Pectobacterium aroidearum]UUE34945.1 dihydrolipoyl dehydrogenase [Pectobacterium aroidearum]UUE39322.1 dihydrolipoyl dehydrogenase [Pectobacterium aroidearum]
MAHDYDVAVIGAGPGGYVAAIRAAQLGLSTVCIDEYKNSEGKASLGGTCLNVGCIPSKALLQSSENFAAITHRFPTQGITVSHASIDIQQMQNNKQQIVDRLTQGIGLLFHKNKVTQVHGHAQILPRKGDKWVIDVDGKETITATSVIIASGSSPRPLPELPFDNERILDNQGALGIRDVPKRLGVIGAGVIGLELGSVWSRLGAEVTILEAMPALLPVADRAVSKQAKSAFASQGIDIQIAVKINHIALTEQQVEVSWSNAEKEQVQQFDKLLVAIGRLPHTDNLWHPDVQIKKDERGFIQVDDQCRTSAPGIWAVGDVVRGPMLAHKASEEGAAVAERIAGKYAHLNFSTIPNVIYTSPEIAWVGKTEEQLKTEGVGYKKGQFPFSANGRAQGLGETVGMVKMLADASTDRILGVHIVGPFASELIAEAVVAMEFQASSEDIARIIHAHPSLSEVIHEAALACDKRAIHN